VILVSLYPYPRIQGVLPVFFSRRKTSKTSFLGDFSMFLAYSVGQVAPKIPPKMLGCPPKNLKQVPSLQQDIPTSIPSAIKRILPQKHKKRGFSPVLWWVRFRKVRKVLGAKFGDAGIANTSRG